MDVPYYKFASTAKARQKMWIDDTNINEKVRIFETYERREIWNVKKYYAGQSLR